LARNPEPGAVVSDGEHPERAVAFDNSTARKLADLVSKAALAFSHAARAQKEGAYGAANP
jgi:hypothetical protein